MLQPLIWPGIGCVRAELVRRFQRMRSGVVLMVNGRSVGSPSSMRPPRKTSSLSAAW